MENRVRDLEQLQERDSDEQRKRGTLAMAALAILMLAFAIGMVVGKAFEPASPQRDPLDQLDRVAEASRAPADLQPAAASAERAKSRAAKPVVEAADLTFERSLTEKEERPEVLAALEAAEREEERMAVHSATAPEDRDGADLHTFDADEEWVEDVKVKPASVPASLAAGAATQKLERAKQYDKLIAAALPRATPGTRAGSGSDGEYTLQVISYDSRATADSFATALRARGHAAFVATGEVEGRGRYYRVRLGPFRTREAAEEYRRSFEQREHMNTIVIKRSTAGSD